MLPVLPFIVGGVVGLVAGVIAKTIMDSSDDFHSTDDNTSDDSTYTTLFTEFDTKGAYSHKRRKMLMCVVPTEKYTLLKNAIHEIDSDAFIVVSDCYEVLGGTKRKKLSFDN